MLSLIENYKGLVQLKMNWMIYIKQACSTAFDVNVFKARVLFFFFFFLVTIFVFIMNNITIHTILPN